MPRSPFDFLLPYKKVVRRPQDSRSARSACSAPRRRQPLPTRRWSPTDYRPTIFPQVAFDSTVTRDSFAARAEEWCVYAILRGLLPGPRCGPGASRLAVGRPATRPERRVDVPVLAHRDIRIGRLRASGIPRCRLGSAAGAFALAAPFALVAANRGPGGAHLPATALSGFEVCFRTGRWWCTRHR